MDLEELTTPRERLIYLRKRLLKLTQENFCINLNIKRSTLSNIEKGRINLTDRTISDICRVFNVSREWLAHGEGDAFHSGERADIIQQIELLARTLRQPYQYELLGYMRRLLDEQRKGLHEAREDAAANELIQLLGVEQPVADEAGKALQPEAPEGQRAEQPVGDGAGEQLQSPERQQEKLPSRPAPVAPKRQVKQRGEPQLAYVGAGPARTRSQSMEAQQGIEQNTEEEPDNKTVARRVTFHRDNYQATAPEEENDRKGKK